MLPALGNYVAMLIAAFELKHGMRPNALIVSMLDAIYLSRALASWAVSCDDFPDQQETLGGLELIPSTKGNQEPRVCLI